MGYLPSSYCRRCGRKITRALFPRITSQRPIETANRPWLPGAIGSASQMVILVWNGCESPKGIYTNSQGQRPWETCEMQADPAGVARFRFYRLGTTPAGSALWRDAIREPGAAAPGYLICPLRGRNRPSTKRPIRLQDCPTANKLTPTFNCTRGYRNRGDRITNKINDLALRKNTQAD
jgi:hypothetical protein